MNITGYHRLKAWCAERGVTLVAVSKTHSPEAIKTLYDLGQRDFGENKVQELLPKYEALPKDIRWHLVGHLQTNKVKYIAPFIHLVHSVDSADLLNELDKQARKNNRVIDYLLQIHIAEEESKYGIKVSSFDVEKSHPLPSPKGGGENVRLRGLMGMATNTNDVKQIAHEFSQLKQLFDTLKDELAAPAFDTLSMGMSSDYEIAVAEGSTLVRVGSLIFGERAK